MCVCVCVCLYVSARSPGAKSKACEAVCAAVCVCTVSGAEWLVAKLLAAQRLTTPSVFGPIVRRHADSYPSYSRPPPLPSPPPSPPYPPAVIRNAVQFNVTTIADNLVRPATAEVLPLFPAMDRFAPFFAACLTTRSTDRTRMCAVLYYVWSAGAGRAARRAGVGPLLPAQHLPWWR